MGWPWALSFHDGCLMTWVQPGLGNLKEVIPPGPEDQLFSIIKPI